MDQDVANMLMARSEEFADMARGNRARGEDATAISRERYADAYARAARLLLGGEP